MDRHESLSSGLLTGLRRPRTGLCRRPRSGTHRLVISSPPDSLSALISSTSSVSSDDTEQLLGEWQGQANAAARVSGVTPSLVRKNSRDMHVERSHGCNDRIADGKSGDCTSHRREEQRDERVPHRDIIMSSKRDADGICEKTLSREDNGYAVSSECEGMDKVDKIEKIRTSPEKNFLDIFGQGIDVSSNEFEYSDRVDRTSTEFECRNIGVHFITDRDWCDHFHKDSRERSSDLISTGHRNRSSNRDCVTDRDRQNLRMDDKDAEVVMDSPMKHQTFSKNVSGSGFYIQGRYVRSFKNGFEPQYDKLPSHSPISVDKSPAEKRSTKLKLKVGGVTHIILQDGVRLSDSGKHKKHLSSGRPKNCEGSRSFWKNTSIPVSERNKPRQLLALQENSDDEGDEVMKAQHQDILKEETISRAYGSAMARPLEFNYNTSPPLQAVRKSSRVPKKRVFDGDEDDGPELKMLLRRKAEEDSDEDQYRGEEDEEEDITGDDNENIAEGHATGKRRKRKRVECYSYTGDINKETSLTAGQRTIQLSKDGSNPHAGESSIELPGLTHSFPKKQKELFSETEQQMKKEEAARKRRQQVEKVTKEIQAVAIQKILSQESQRKKREEKLQRLRQELEQEKKAAAMLPPSNSIRWVMGPSGNVVSFSEDLELPKIFSGPCSYPKKRETCAAPLCTNAYKYRDSKSHLPLCSLQCYRAMQNLPSVASAH